MQTKFRFTISDQDNSGVRVVATTKCPHCKKQSLSITGEIKYYFKSRRFCSFCENCGAGTPGDVQEKYCSEVESPVVFAEEILSQTLSKPDKESEILQRRLMGQRVHF